MRGNIHHSSSIVDVEIFPQKLIFSGIFRHPARETSPGLFIQPAPDAASCIPEIRTDLKKCKLLNNSHQCMWFKWKKSVDKLGIRIKFLLKWIALIKSKLTNSQASPFTS